MTNATRALSLAVVLAATGSPAGAPSFYDAVFGQSAEARPTGAPLRAALQNALDASRALRAPGVALRALDSGAHCADIPLIARLSVDTEGAEQNRRASLPTSYQSPSTSPPPPRGPPAQS